MKSSKYSQVPDIFLNEDISTFTKLHQFDIAYKRVADAIKQPIKLVLLYGKPGTGKTFLLNKLYFDLKTTMCSPL